ncbi:hypothetical protein EDD85DRAFT_957461 [Armillaria nabsnona]|nr:hypothetical protein EDD85DRAFT_957461 [Armillaria nabsnona]
MAMLFVYLLEAPEWGIYIELCMFLLSLVLTFVDIEKPGPDFDEDEWQEWFRAREEEDDADKKARGPVPKPRMISRKRKATSEPDAASEDLLHDGSAKPSGRPAKRTRKKKT